MAKNDNLQKLSDGEYEKQLVELQIELVKFQRSLIAKGERDRKSVV